MRSKWPKAAMCDLYDSDSLPSVFFLRSAKAFSSPFRNRLTERRFERNITRIKKYFVGHRR